MSENSIPEGFKMTELGSLPEEWEVVRLGDVANLVMGQSPPGTTYNEIGDGMPFLQGKAEFSALYPKHVKYTTKPLKIAPKDSVLISVRAPVGDVNIAQLDYCIGRGLASVALYDGDNIFLFDLLTHLKSALEKEGTGSTFKAINKAKLMDLKIPFPPLPEQHRIAAVLSAVQDTKEKTGEVIAAAKSLKKSLMRHLFTYGPVPAGAAESAVLKETEIGLVPEEWEVVKANDFFFRITDGTHDTPQKLVKGIPLIKSKQIKDGKVNFEDIDYYISNEDCEIVNNRSKVDKFDILLSMIGTVGEVAFVKEKPKFAIKNVGLFKMNSNFDLAIYSYYYFQSKPAKKYIMKNLSGTSQRYITLEKLRKFPIILPPVSTQQKIATILSAVDKKIEVEQTKRKTLNELFKSLLQNLMTGKLRANEF